MANFTLLDAVDATGTGVAFSGASAEEGYDGIHTYQVNITGTTSAVTVGIDGSLDGVLWTELAEHVVTAGELTATTAMFNLTGKPVTFLRGNLKTLTLEQTAQVDTVTPVAVNDTTYEVTVAGVLYSYTSDATALLAEVTLGITNAINAGGGAETAADTGTTVTITADVAGTPFVTTVGANLSVETTTPNDAGASTVTVLGRVA